MVLTIFAPTFSDANVSQDTEGSIIATTSFKPGQVLFYEASLVSSSSRVNFQHDKINMSDAVVEQFDDIIQFCASNELLNMMDLSKNLFQLFNLIMKDFDIMKQLQVLRIQNGEVYIIIAQELQENFPSIVPTSLTVDNIAHLIGVLHVHSHELDDIHGTGLFPAIARLRHKCIPNCNITTDGDIIWVTAIAPIAFGEPISLDLFDLYYTTAQERLDLLTLEGIQCSCSWCSGGLPDLSRGFKCVQESCCGIAHPNNEEFFCQSCNSKLSATEIIRLLKAEENLSEAVQGLIGVAELLKLMNDSPVHRYHKLFYNAVTTLNEKLMEQEAMDYEEFAMLHHLAIKAASHAVPYPHYRKIQHYDELAQTLISIGDIIGAKEAYAQAYAMSCICSGSQSQQASFLRQLADTTPVNRQELLAVYERLQMVLCHSCHCKGVVATTALAPGQVIFQENALVYSNFGNMHADDGHESDCDDEDCGGCVEVSEDDKEVLDEEEISHVSPAVAANFDKLMEFCENHDVLSMVDIRKNLFKCFFLANKDASALNEVYQLKVISEDVAACMDTAIALRSEFPAIIPPSMTDANVAHIIGVLHNHSQALEDIDGSGLFVHISKLKHSSLPNCNLTVTGTTMWVTAIKPISPLEPLTIDLMDVFYSAANDRAEALLTEEIECTCGYCTGTFPDFARAYKCKNRSCSGIVHPTKAVFACTVCNVKWSAEEIAEAEVLEMPLVVQLDEAKSLEEYDEIIEASPMHKYHHICYMALENLSTTWSDEDDAEIAAVCKRMLNCINYVVPYPHEEKTQHYDNLAQALISLGDIAGATAAYQEAYKMSALCSGLEYEKTNFYKRLVDNTPKTKEEWLSAYGFDNEDDESFEIILQLSMPLSFEAPIFTRASVSQDTTKPIVATAAFVPGQVIFQEEAFVSSSFGNMDMDECHDADCEDEDCGGCVEIDEEELEELDEDDLQAVSPAVVDNFDKLMQFCEPTEVLNMVDIRKNLFKCFHLFEANTSTLNPLYALSINQDDASAFLETAVALRKEFPSVVPSGMTDDNVAHIIGVLNKHCHALEEINGSGLFLYVSKLPHACLPNCNITVSGTSMWVTAIKPIAVGEPLSLDILDLFYSPVSDRLESMAEDGMVCTCASCTETIPDFARAFKCKDTKCTGIVHPKKGVFACTACGKKFTPEQISE
ncbi:hypothetical protein THRCLA_04288, partial [Thraustotheca clavata]